jgi:hypothetical protein
MCRLCMYIYSDLGRWNKCWGQIASIFWSWYFVNVRKCVVNPISEAFVYHSISCAHNFIILACIGAITSHNSTVMLDRAEHTNALARISEFWWNLLPELDLLLMRVEFIWHASSSNKYCNVASPLDLWSATCGPCRISVRPATLLGN